jgi:hypothetical protein
VPTTARRLIDAFLAGDVPSAAALLAPDATFHSPIRDYAGSDRIGRVWRAVAGVVAEARPTSVHERNGEAIAFFAGARSAKSTGNLINVDGGVAAAYPR